MASAFNPIGVFDESVTPDFLRRTIRCLFDSYKLAWETCKEGHDWPEAHDLLGGKRRALFQGQWREIANSIPGMKAVPESNAAGNCFHTVVTCGRVMMTESRVSKPNEIVRDAIFRQTYARSRQLYLLDSHDVADPSPDAPLYAIFIHAPSTTPSIPSFAHVVFPSPDCREYIARIRLEERFPEMFGDIDIATDVEHVRDDAFGNLRDDIENQDRKQA